MSSMFTPEVAMRVLKAAEDYERIHSVVFREGVPLFCEHRSRLIRSVLQARQSGIVTDVMLDEIIAQLEGATTAPGVFEVFGLSVPKDLL